MGAEMYTGMSALDAPTPTVERGMSLHKMIRTITQVAGGNNAVQCDTMQCNAMQRVECCCGRRGGAVGARAQDDCHHTVTHSAAARPALPPNPPHPCPAGPGR
jgi:hypothetical protein